ncbi:MAG: FAD-dependent oxidoreductase [Bryobacterales bacterium]|nr:FAD-dependent oxidoreductase [Bryobacterales bacterium]
MNRRAFLGTGALALSSCVSARKTVINSPAQPAPAPSFRLTPIRAEVDRLFRITVCVRPFRAAGPRLDVEKVGEKTVVHNYGHGGSGWSLSWGSARVVTEKALATGERDIAVIGCGALGITAAITLQRAGAKVIIYAKDRPPDVRSSRATGSWTPDSRIALTNAISADFPALWERMCRDSWHMYESFLGLPGNPVEWTDRYMLSDGSPAASRPSSVDELDFAHFQDRIRDITPRSLELAVGTHPFPTRYARRNSGLTFNIAAYQHRLVSDFLLEGGRIERREFQSPSDLTALPQRTILNCTGYGARALWNDNSIVPVRGQIAWLIPQADVHYGVMYKGIYVLGRRDGIVVQDGGSGEMEGYDVDNETPDRAAAEANVRTIAEVFRNMRT